MSIPTIYFDESGNSGANLLDRDQPIFTLVSHNFNAIETSELLSELKSISNANELHFKSLRKYSKSRRAIINLLNHRLIEKERIFTYHVLKDFAVTVQLIDQLVEPVLIRQGIDIYKYGFNLSTTNLMYICELSLWDKNLVAKIKDNFLTLFKHPHDNTIKDFYDSVRSLQRDNANRGVINLGILEWILESEKSIRNILQPITKYSLDLTLTTFVVHCDHWARKMKKPFDVIFDDSKQISYWDEMIRFLIESLPDEEVGYGSRKMKFPLLINSIKMANSENQDGVQLADILGSSVTYAMKHHYCKNEDEFTKQIKSSNLFQKVTGNSMAPSTSITPRQLNMEDEGGKNILDFLADIVVDNGGFSKKFEN